MRRELIVNWSEEHVAVKRELENPRGNLMDVGESGPGWSYVTFFGPGTQRDAVLFDINSLEHTAQDNGYFLPREVLTQHNKVVVAAFSQVGSNPSMAIFALYKLMEAYAARYNNPRKYPRLGFYGKVGGFFERPEKGRVLAIYAPSDEMLIEVAEAFDETIKRLKFKGVSFDYRLSNGLSAIPRILDGFDDPTYREAGVTHFRITNPGKFEMLLEQAKRDYGNYLFEKSA